MRGFMIIVLTASLYVGVILLLGYFIEKTGCLQKAVSFVDHKYGVFSGCMVYHNNKWLPLDIVRAFDNRD